MSEEIEDALSILDLALATQDGTRITLHRTRSEQVYTTLQRQAEIEGLLKGLINGEEISPTELYEECNHDARWMDIKSKDIKLIIDWVCEYYRILKPETVIKINKIMEK